MLTSERLINGRRYYTEINLCWVQFIRRLKETAMPLKKIKQGEATFALRAQLLAEHREFVQAQLQLWQDNLLSIGTKIHDYQQAIKYYKSNK